MEPVLISLTEEKTFPLNSPSTFIGRDQWRVNIRLPGDAVADVHCELIRQKAGFRLINLSETGTLVNGESVTEADIGDGDELTIASHRLRLFCAVETAESPEETVHGKTELSIEDRWSALNMSTAVTESAKEPRQTPDGTVLQIAQTTSEIAAQTVVEPQFFVMLGGHETGPLPLHALQQLAQDHRITADTPVKTEDVSHWSTAAGLNIDIPPLPVPSEPPDTEPVTDNADAKSCEASSSTAQWMLARCTWVLLSPVFYISACVRAVSALSPRMLIGGTAVTIALSATLFFWYRGWTQTAVMGTLTLDGKPLSGVTVTLTGMGTGGAAVGFTDSSGRFSAKTLDGSLAPGRYHITLNTLSGSAAGQREKHAKDVLVPRKYFSLGTSDAIIQIMPDQSNYNVTLSTKLSGAFFEPER